MSHVDRLRRFFEDGTITGDPVEFASLLYDHLAVLLAFEAGEVSTGRAANLAGLDIIDLRARNIAVIRHGIEVAGVPAPARYSMSTRGDSV